MAAAAFARNAWYCAGFSADLAANQVRAMTILGQPLVLFRDASGAPAALVDRCPHRFAPLSRGRVCEGNLQCGYHGLQFNSSGQCVHNPHGPGVAPKAATVRAFAVLERHATLWIWMGDADRADVSLLPDFSVVEERPGWSRVQGYLHVKANYQLVTDNLLDLSHVQFLHPFLATGGPPPENFRPEFRTEQRGTTVEAINQMSSIWNTPLYRLLWERGDAPDVVDMRANMRWDPPSLLFLDTGATVVGGARELGPTLSQGHWLTPETELTTHYFWALARDRYVHDAAVGEQVRAGIDSAFRNEDEPMIEAVQHNMHGADLWAEKPVMLSTDNAAVRARRIVDKMIAAEAETAATGKSSLSSVS
jgi:vanillate O-demethylase monooxygenase subunit